MTADPLTVPVALGDRSYNIHIGTDLLRRAGDFMAPLLSRPRVFVVADATVDALHGETLRHALSTAGIDHHTLRIPPGEASKSFARLEALLEELLALRVERGDTLVALGGGVVGDLCGVAASVLLRGVAFLQVPTTLLSQVDSSVGGKTGINSRHGKNLIGTFHQPRLVLADMAVLETLSAREVRAGYAEVVKYGLIDRPDFFAWLETHGPDLLAGDRATRAEAVRVSCTAKAAIVAADEREGHQRALLNLGHTFGHALEAECGYGDTLLHGEAVAIGMVMAFALSVRLGRCSEADLARVRAHLAASGLPVRAADIRSDFDPDRLLGHMAHDKKVRDGQVTFVLADGLGAARLVRDVPLAEVRAVLAESVAPPAP